MTSYITHDLPSEPIRREARATADALCDVFQLRPINIVWLLDDPDGGDPALPSIANRYGVVRPTEPTTIYLNASTADGDLPGNTAHEVAHLMQYASLLPPGPDGDLEPWAQALARDVRTAWDTRRPWCLDRLLDPEWTGGNAETYQRAQAGVRIVQPEPRTTAATNTTAVPRASASRRETDAERMAAVRGAWREWQFNRLAGIAQIAHIECASIAHGRGLLRGGWM